MGASWVFSHQAVILSFRVAFEGLSEKEVLDIDASTQLANCSMTRYTCGPSGGWSLEAFGDTRGVSRLAPETHEQPTAQRRGGEDDERR